MLDHHAMGSGAGPYSNGEVAQRTHKLDEHTLPLLHERILERVATRTPPSSIDLATAGCPEARLV